MAYATRRFIKHIDKYDTVHRLEIQQDGYGGSATRLNGDKDKGAFKFEHEDVTDEEEFLKVYANPIQKGKLKIYPVVEDAADLTLLTDIFEADEEEFRLVWKRDGSIFWTGYVLQDLLEFDEAPYPYTSTIVAKDFSRLKGMGYTLDDTRQTWITTIADLLGNLNLGLNIETATSWINENTTDGTDYLQQIYHETKALREFAKTGDETDQPITVWEALERVLSDNCLILKQIDGKFKIDQLTAYDDPSSVLVTTYDSTGSQLSSSTEDKRLTYDRNVRRVKSSGSKSKGFVAIKRAEVKYDHRTKVTTIKFPASVLMESTSDSPKSYLQAFISDGDQQITFRASLEAQTDDTVGDQHALYTIEADSYYWDEENHQWVDGTFTDNRVDMTDTWASGGKLGWMGSINITTADVPADADGTLTVTIYISRGDSTGAGDYTEWTDLDIDIINAIADENSTSINYKLTQTAGFSEDYEHADTWYGDLPTGYSVGALRYGSGAGDLTADDWQRRGSTSYRNYHENLLKEIIDIQRTWVRRLEAAMYGSYDPTGMLQYRSGNYYYIGGSFDGASGDWNVRLMDVDVQEDSNDTFDDIPKFTDETGSGSGSTSSGGSGGGLDQGTADARYFKQGSNLSEGDPATMRANMGVVIGTDVQAWDADLQDLSDNLTADASELNRLDGNLATVRGNLGLKDGSASLDLASLDVDDINIDGNTIQAQNGQNLVLDGNGNDVLVNGDTIKIDKEMTTTDNVIVLNEGEAGSGITAGEAGLQFDRGTETNYEILFQESDGLFSIGQVGDLQPVLTREVSPDTDGLFYFDNSDNRAVTSSDLTFDGSELAVGVDARFSTDVFVEGGLFAEEFVVQQNRLISEQKMGPMGGKIESVSGSAGSETITFSSDYGAGNPVSAGALIKIQSRTGLRSGTIVKRILRKVDSISGMDATLTTTGVNDTDGTSYSASDDVGSIEAGDHAVGEGHASDGTLDHFIHFDVANVDTPAIRFFDDATNFDSRTEFLRVGGLDSFQSFGSQDVGIGVGEAHYLQANANSGAGKVSFADGVFTAERDGSGDGLVGLAGFTVNSDYLTDGQTYIGDDLVNNVSTRTNKLLIGDIVGEPGITAYGNALNTYVYMRARTATSDPFLRVQVDGNEQLAISEDQSRLASGYFDGTDLWGGNATKADATVRLDFASGDIIYDGMGGPIYSEHQVASTALNTSVQLSQGQWKSEVTSNGSNQSFNDTKFVYRYYHKRGIRRIVVSGHGEFGTNVEGGDPSYSTTSEVQASVGGISDSVEVESASEVGGTDFELELDTTGLTPGNTYQFEFRIFGEINAGSFGSGESVTLTVYANRDISMIESGTNS